MNLRTYCSALLLLGLGSLSAQAGFVSGSYTELPAGTNIDLTATGQFDWIKFGNGENNSLTFLTTTKIGNPIFLPGNTQPIGDPDAALIAFTGQGNLNFFWTDGNFGMYNVTGPVDTVMGETLDPFSSPYPIGLGASIEAKAATDLRRIDVYVQGFNADMVITATMSGGGPNSQQQILVSPSQNPPGDPNNDYALGVYSALFSGSDEILTITVNTQNPVTDGAQADFANAGFFAATVQIPEPSTFLLAALGLLPCGFMARRKRSRS
jgi:hypothetical protein